MAHCSHCEQLSPGVHLGCPQGSLVPIALCLFPVTPCTVSILPVWPCKPWDTVTRCPKPSFSGWPNPGLSAFPHITASLGWILSVAFLDLLYSVQVFLFLKWGPLDTIFQLWPDKCWEEGDNDFISAGKALVAAVQHHPGHSDLFTSLRDKAVYFTHKTDLQGYRICPGNFFNPDCPFCVGCVCKFFLGERGVEPCPVFQVWAKQSINQSWNFHYLY